MSTLFKTLLVTARMPNTVPSRGSTISPPLALQSTLSSSWGPTGRPSLARAAQHIQHTPLPRTPTAMFSSSSFTASSSSFALASRLNGLEKPTVWHEFSPLAVQHGAVNLGQGFPDWDPPEFVRQAMMRSIDPAQGRHANQYARSYAHLPLAQALVDEYQLRWGPDLPDRMPMNPATQVATAVGASNVCYCALHGLLNPGDEVILFEPAFDIYISQVLMTGATPIFVPLRPNLDLAHDGAGASQVFTLNLEEVAAAITPRTKLLILNTPHNPTGKMFSRPELQGLADLLQQPGHEHITILADEVYEHLALDPDQEPHISMATLPGMFDRTLTMSSSGKTFSCTGWKVGWAVGPPHLVHAVTAVQQWVNFSAPTPNQDAIAQSLIQARQQPYQGYENYYEYLRAEYRRKRSLLVEALRAAGMTPVIPAGGFFIMAETSQVDFPYETQYQQQVTPAMPCRPMPRDWALSRWLTETVGVTAIPPSAFYSPDTIFLARHLLRFAYCKSDDTLRRAQERFTTYFQPKKK